MEVEGGGGKAWLCPPSCPHTLDLCPQILKPPGLVSSHLEMDNKKRLAYSIIRFLHDQLQHGELSSDAQESLEGTCGPCPPPGASGPMPNPPPASAPRNSMGWE